MLSRLDRAAGVLVGGACGDALGVPHEFEDPAEGRLRMSGGGLGPYAPGEWSDDTQMTLCIALGAVVGELTGVADLDRVADRFLRWRTDGATDVGVATDAVLTAAGPPGEGSAARLRRAARQLHERTGRTAGNGALMRTSVVALVPTAGRDETADLASRVAALTHADPLVSESCVLWTEAVRRAVVDGALDLRSGLDLISANRRAAWSVWIDEAESQFPTTDFSRNGYTVTALQAAWRAVWETTSSSGVREQDFRAAIEAAVRFGGDTDTVAAIAGSLAGALCGVGGVPVHWWRIVHGWPGMRLRTLSRLAVAIASLPVGDRPCMPSCVAPG